MIEIYVTVQSRYKAVDTATKAALEEFFSKVLKNKPYCFSVAYRNADAIIVVGGGKGAGVITLRKLNTAANQALACVRNRCKSALGNSGNY